MIRILVFVLLVLAAASGFAWLADRPGTMTILWQGQEIEMSLMVAVSLFCATLLTALLSWWVLRSLWLSPKAVSRYFRARKRDRGYQALSTGLIAAGAGNAVLAARMAERTRGLLSADQEPLIHLLEAQTAMIRGDHDAARRKFEAMADDPETRELGLRGLHMEARRAGADEAAEHYARQAVEKAPYLPWASQAVLEYRTRAGDFDGALDLLAKQRASGTGGGRNLPRERAVLLTARAAAKLEADPNGAREDARQALKLHPALVPAAVIAAKAYFREGNLRKGSAVLEQIWKLEPHPEIAETYIRARGGDTALDRLKRAERLEALKPGNPIGLAATAQAALEARLFDKAREKAEAALKRDPREGLLALLADIEEAERATRHGSGIICPWRCAPRATRPGWPMAWCRSAGRRFRRSPASSVPSYGNRQSARRRVRYLRSKTCHPRRSPLSPHRSNTRRIRRSLRFLNVRCARTSPMPKRKPHTPRLKSPPNRSLRNRPSPRRLCPSSDIRRTIRASESR